MNLLETSKSLDESLFFLVNNLPHPAALDQIFLFFSFYPLLVWILLGFGLVIIEEQKDKWFVIRLVVALVIAGAISSIVLKPLVKRPRPDISHGQQVNLVREKPALFPWNNNFAFPSGHAAIAFAGAYIISREERMRKRKGSKKSSKLSSWILYLLATMTAFSRIYLGKHYPLDVIVGAMIGISVGWGVWKVIDIVNPPRVYS